MIEYEGEKLGLLHNTSGEPITVDLAECEALNGHAFKKVCDAIGAGKETLKGTVLTLDAYTSVVLQ